MPTTAPEGAHGVVHTLVSADLPRGPDTFGVSATPLFPSSSATHQDRHPRIQVGDSSQVRYSPPAPHGIHRDLASESVTGLPYSPKPAVLASGPDIREAVVSDSQQLYRYLK